jgi:hypothetical protein
VVSTRYYIVDPLLAAIQSESSANIAKLQCEPIQPKELTEKLSCVKTEILS